MPFADRVNTWRSEALRRRAQKRQAMALEIESKAAETEAFKDVQSMPLFEPLILQKKLNIIDQQQANSDSQAILPPSSSTSR